MNNISREMILEQALKDCLKDHVGENGTDLRVWWKYYMDNAEKELEGKCVLTKNQKTQLQKYINMLTEFTHHGYFAIQFDKDPVRHMKFYHNYGCPDLSILYDTISPCPISFADDVFEFGKRYELDEILEVVQR